MKVVCEICHNMVDQDDAVYIGCMYYNIWNALLGLRTIRWRCAKCQQELLDKKKK